MEKNSNKHRIRSALLQPAHTLLQQALQGGFWVFLLRISHRLLLLARIIILARQLAPGDFGILGIALLAMSILETFTETGFDSALIHNQNNINAYLNTAWTASVIRGVGLYAILFLSAPLVAIFFDTPQVIPLVRIISLSLIANGFSNTAIIYFKKNIQFQKQFVYQLSGSLVDFVVSVIGAFLFKNIYALAIGLVAGNLTRCLASYLTHPFRPKFRFEKEKAKELLGYGQWVFASKILTFFLTEGDDIFASKLLGATALGLYQMAYKISNIPATEFSHMIAQVAFPIYAQVQDDKKKLRFGYLMSLRLTALMTTPLAAIICVLSADATNMLLGEKWMAMVPSTQVLSIYGYLRAIGATTGVVFLALGKPQIRTKIQVGQFLLLAAIIYPLTKYLGITGTSIAVVAYALIFNAVAVYQVTRLIEIRIWTIIQVIMRYIVFSLMPIGLVIGLKVSYFTSMNLLELIGVTTLGFITYMMTLYIFDPVSRSYFKGILKGKMITPP